MISSCVVLKEIVDALFAADFNADDAWHSGWSAFGGWFRLSLPLFVPGIGANHPDDAFAADNFAIFAELFDGGADFHALLTMLDLL